MKKTRIAPFACLLLGSFLTAGCTLYKNPSTCEAQMRAAVAHALPHDKLSISHVGVGIGGARVVVEGTLSSSAATSAAGAASAVHASSTAAASKAASRSAAVECAFNGDALTTWHWLNPPELAKPAASAKSDVTQH